MTQSGKDWKEKYFATLKELDDRESYWRRVESILRQGVSRLATLSQDGHPDLDRSLHKVRTLSRGNNNIPALESALDAIGKAGGNGYAGTENTEIAAAIKSISGLLPLNLVELNSIVGLCDKQDDQAALKTLIRAIAKLSRPEQTLDHEALATSLLSMLTGLDSHETDAAVLQALERDISASSTPRQWRAVIEKTLDQVGVELKTLHDKKTRLLLFIKQLTEQLAGLEQHALSAMENAARAKQRATDMSTNLSDELTSLSDDVVASENLHELKQQVSYRLGSALQNIQEYFTREDQHFADAEKANKVLAVQLKSARSEVSDLREALVKSQQAQRTDTLTGLANRYAYDERVHIEIARHQRASSPLVYALWDIDHFKSVNDDYGHMAGDVVLKLVAQLLQKSIRQTDFVARIGGEEFALLLPDTDASTGQTLVDGIRDTIASNSFSFKGQTLSVTASCGYTLMRKGDNVDALYERADKALYQAKNAGRNRCCIDVAA